MARKKVKKDIEEPKVEEQSQKQDTENKITLEYQGKVNIKVVNNKKIIDKKTLFNKGTDRLFNFIYNCIIGKFTMAKELKPRKIMLFDVQGTGPTEQDNFDNPVLTGFIAENTSGTIDKMQDGETPCAVLHFLVPFSILDSGTSKINQICLYSSNATNYNEPSAIYQLVNDAGTWDPIVVNSKSADYNLVIEWEMSISNKTNN